MSAAGAVPNPGYCPASLANDLRRLGVGLVREQAPLREYCTWQIGGPADVVVEPGSGEELARCLQYLHPRCPVVCIGHGTNLLFDDAGLRGAIIRIGGRMSNFHIEGLHLKAQSGAWVPWLARSAAKAGLGGLEHIIGIPGTLGGLVVMNGGSMRKSIGEHVHLVRAVDPEGNLRSFTQQECAFAYRTSVLQKAGLIVTEVELSCPPGNPREMLREMLGILRDRNRKFPPGPNCGSVFVSSPELFNLFGPPGKVIEEAGLKGHRVGDAEVTQKHANFIRNLGQATCRDTLELIRQVRERVHARTGYWLICEVRHVGVDGRVRPASELFEH